VTRYRITPERSRVWIDGTSSVHEIHSTAEGLEGTVDLEWDADGKLVTGERVAGALSLPVIGLSSGNRMEDRELQKRIDSRRFPTIEGALDRVDPSGGDGGGYRVGGRITFRGVTRSYEGAMSIERTEEGAVRLAGSSRFDIRDFGMEPPKILMLKVSPVVEVRVEIFAVETDAGKAAGVDRGIDAGKGDADA
jgi:hypothetical protein